MAKANNVDWLAIKTEYITSNPATSYRKLAAKYGVSATQVNNVGRDEHWVQLREQHLSESLAKTLEKISDQTAEKAVKVQSVTDKLLDKVDQMINKINPEELDTGAVRQIGATLKDIKDIYMIRSGADRAEQQARIDKLRADAAKGDKDTGGGLTVSLEGVVSEYGQ